MRSVLSLFALLVVASSALAQTVTVFRAQVCPIGQLAYISASGTSAGCDVPSYIFNNPTAIRCPSFSFLRTTVTIGFNAPTITFTCPSFPSRCPQGFTYPVLHALGAINVNLGVACNRIQGLDNDIARRSCQRVSGIYSNGLGTCLLPVCPSTGCSASPQNCRLVAAGNVNSAPIVCSAIGSICLNFNSPGYAGYACGVPCRGLACYDTTPSVQVCDAVNNRCAVCSTGTRLDALTCSGGVSGSQAPTRRRDRLLKERKDKIAREHALCPAGLTPCSVGFGRDGAYECLDTQSELESCGGCRSTGLGTDCSALTGVRMGAATCDRGRCVVSACRAGFKLKDGRCL
ncbi:hypothetical protein BDY24DRAFT_417642 [Mrakia frigida]|uniref:uncharacterized protein n=1 Tax=Mrakia frigida TaxID=29902 RepID=UPI003FCC1C14